MTRRHALAATQFLVAAILCLASICDIQGQPASELAELLTDFEQEQTFSPQFEIAKQIVALNDDDALPKLEKWLDHEDRHLRANVAFVFAGLGDMRGFDALYAIIDDRSGRPVGQGIPEAQIRANSGSEGWWVPRQVLADRYYAVHLLGVLRDPRAVDELLSLETDVELRGKVMWALAEIPHVWETQLRIWNSGSDDISNLTVLTPKGAIEFGDIPSGITTPYTDAPDGVYGYAAYRLEVDGKLVTQPVIDWPIHPIAGKSFTYRLELVPSQVPSRRLAVHLVGIAVEN